MKNQVDRFQNQLVIVRSLPSLLIRRDSLVREELEQCIYLKKLTTKTITLNQDSLRLAMFSQIIDQGWRTFSGSWVIYETLI